MIRSLSCNEHKKVDTPIKLRRCQSGGSYHGQGGRRTVPSSGTWSLRLPFCCRKSIQIPWWDRWIFHTVVASLFFPEKLNTRHKHMYFKTWFADVSNKSGKSHVSKYDSVSLKFQVGRAVENAIKIVLKSLSIYNGIWNFLVG